MAVVAGTIADRDGRLLMQRRPPGKRHAGLWEFPGGKVEPGESPRNALVRELHEELRISVLPTGITPLAFAEGEPSESEPGIVILLYSVSRFEGQPVAEDGAAIGWFTVSEIGELPLPPLDVILLHALGGLQR